MKKRIYIKPLHIIFYVLGIFLFQEVVFRFAFPIPEISNFDRINYMHLQYDGQGIEHSRSKTRLWQSQLDTTTIFQHKMNQYGFRDEEWKIEKPTNKKRAIFIGDSFVEGVMANQKETLTQSFETASNTSYEVLNGGMLGCGLSVYLQLATDIIPVFKPDVTFLCIYANDLGKNIPKTPKYYLEPEYFKWYTPRLYEFYKQTKTYGPLLFKWHNQKDPYLYATPNKINPWTLKENELIKEVTPQIATLMKKASFNSFLTNSLFKEEKYLKRYPPLGETIPFFKYTCDKFGTKPVVIYIPSRNQVSKYYLPFEKEYCLNKCSNIFDLTEEKYQLHQQVIQKQCKQFNIDFIDLSTAIKNEEDKGNHLYWNYDQHMRAKGYKLLGETIWNEFNN